jgi:small subunit ribosomal protein S6
LKKYEGMFLVDQETANKKWDEVIGHIRGTLEKYKAVILDLEKWQDLKLAYPIKKRRKGTYIVGHFNLAPNALAEIRHDFQLSEVVLRHIIIVDTGERQILIEETPPEAATAPAAKPAAAVEEVPDVAEEVEDIVSEEEKAD